MKKFSVIAGNASTDLAKKIAGNLNAKFVSTELREFPDGESKITFNEKPDNGTIVVVQSTYPPVDTNLLQALSLISKAKKYSQDVIAVVPYLGYARQDREFLPGEIVTMETISGLFKAAGAKKIIVVDVHSVLGLGLFKIKTLNISAVSELVNYFKKIKLSNPLVISPDLGGIERAKKFANLLGTEFVALEKHRDRKTGAVRIKSSKMEHISNRDLIIVDDMISTGGSIIKATQFLKKQKCKRVFVACTHALMINGAEKKIMHAGVTKIISTNTIPGKSSLVDVSDLISKAIQ